MNDTLLVTCPGCSVVLVVDKQTGKVLETRKPIIPETTGDRFEDARLKVLSSKERAEQKFEEARQREHDKKAKMEQFFKEKQEELKDQPITRPDRPFDND